MVWIDIIERLFSKTGRSKSAVEGIRVIPAAHNPHRVDLWDCAMFSQSMNSTTKDPGVAAQFTRLRASTGVERRDQLPANASVTDCTLYYPIAQALSDGALFKATEMEDKWDIYLFHPHIYFSRSWSGQLIYRAAVRFEDRSPSRRLLGREPRSWSRCSAPAT